MTTVISTGKLEAIIPKLKKAGKRIVLVGGCFDVLHPGHVIFLEKAKQAGDLLIVLLESDEKIKKLKGVNRPVHTQQERGKVLSALQFVDYLVLLPVMKSDTAYDKLIQSIKPDIIAITAGQASQHQKRAAKLTGAELKAVTRLIGQHSTSRILDR